MKLFETVYLRNEKKVQTIIDGSLWRRKIKRSIKVQ